MSPIHITRLRRRRANEQFEKCEFERNIPRYRDLHDGTIEQTRLYYCFHYFEGGARSSCPFPARMCRPKLRPEAEE